MPRKTSITNEYQKYILSQLQTRQFARFSDIKPPKISSNSFSYHLKELQRGNWISKESQGYTLGPVGLAHAARETEKQAVRMQPNIMVGLLVQDGDGNVLLHKKSEQPFIDAWELPATYASVADAGVQEAGKWAARKLFHMTPPELRHAGDCYVRVHKGKIALCATQFHIVRFAVDSMAAPEDCMWVAPLAIETLVRVPALERIIARAFFNDDFFFEEYTVQYDPQEPLL